MIERGYGRIVNISSVVGEIGNIGQANYAASKAGLFGLTMSMARECANKGITVNSVAPGFIRTEMVDGRPGGGAREGRRADPVRSARRGGRGRAGGRVPRRPGSSYITGDVVLDQRRARDVTLRRYGASDGRGDTRQRSGRAPTPTRGSARPPTRVAFGAALAGPREAARARPGDPRRRDDALRDRARRDRRRRRGAHGRRRRPRARCRRPSRDARFADPAWESNPAFYGLRQCYLLWARTMQELAAAARRTTSSAARRSSPSGSWSTRSRRRTSCSATRRR